MSEQDEPLPDDLIPSIAENALSPKSASGDGQSMEQQSIADQIALDRYRKAAAAFGRGLGGIRRVKMIPPGTVESRRCD